MRISSAGPEMNFVAGRLASAFHQLCGKLHDHTSGAADYTRKVGEILSGVDQRSRPSSEFSTPTPTTPVSAVPTPAPTGPALLSGRQALDDLATRYGDRIVFHGTADPLDRLEPRQMSWADGTGRRYPDGEPAICADASYDIPMFMALFKGRTRYGYGTDADGNVIYRAKGAATEDMSGYTGHVHVMDRRHFQLIDLQAPQDWPDPLNGPRTPELRSSTAVEPFAIVKVTMDDFPHPINDYDT
ncbi:hypothetical protein FOH10_03615 [Nocardia otitidiscaviarum]|uniref:Uncharacterized protein n=1 Tax=Nocardia otitidiscaviarum TaxID=1823 RepID=A0A516NGD2_9NOCA|nr:hypothetical protein [Nocardia otitidiscaviarum]MCP9623344.1 hypothetical protein [Nocardia otitidiscaviarum]QDP77968.1 hypothetical protein FOH10_03615 [Nocardia otitidiscaviarum]